ncbi:hypothetical protein RUND412_008142 [Rhizina undulata]
MAATSSFVSASSNRESTPTDQRRKIIRNGGNVSRDSSSMRDEGEDERPPSKKVKLCENGEATYVKQEAEKPRDSTGFRFESLFAGTNEKASQTMPDFLSDPKTLKAMRETISEQFDMEILLKHRELRLIEQEIAKTQICMEQLRRCTLIPFPSPESILDSPPTAIKLPDNGIPGYAPPPRGIVDGPYTRHYRQWLITDPRFDGWGPHGPPPPPPQQTSGKSLRSLGIVEPGPGLSMSGRPQRQSVMKVQQKGGMGVQACLYRKSDGTVVRLECLDCGRSNFSSAQGFINHCRIAHQREYSSHDAAANACGQEVDEAELALASPSLKNPPDGPARNTRQTQQQLVTPQQTPYAPAKATYSAKSGPKIPAARPNIKMPKPAAQRKNVNRRSSAVMTTPKAPGSENGFGRPLTPPQETFNTPHLEGLLKRKRIAVNLEEMKKEFFEGGRINWDEVNSETEASESETEKEVVAKKDGEGDFLMFDVGNREQSAKKEENETPRPSTPINQIIAMDTLSPGPRRLVSKMSPVPTPTRKQEQHASGCGFMTVNKPDYNNAKENHDIEMEVFDGSISSDEEEDSYKSDAESDGKEEENIPLKFECKAREGSKDSDSTNTDLGFESMCGPLQLQKNYMATNRVHAVSHFSPEPICQMPVKPVAVSIESVVPKAMTPARQASVTSEKFPSKSAEALASTQAGLSKQVRFVMPNVKNSTIMRKFGNTGGVFENGMAKVKFGNAGAVVNGAKNGVFGGFPSNGNGGEVKKV